MELREETDGADSLADGTPQFQSEVQNSSAPHTANDASLIEASVGLTLESNPELNSIKDPSLLLQDQEDDDLETPTMTIPPPQENLLTFSSLPKMMPPGYDSFILTDPDFEPELEEDNLNLGADPNGTEADSMEGKLL
jgi:hypothetical protein